MFKGNVSFGITTQSCARLQRVFYTAQRVYRAEALQMLNYIKHLLQTSAWIVKLFNKIHFLLC